MKKAVNKNEKLNTMNDSLDFIMTGKNNNSLKPKNTTINENKVQKLRKNKEDDADGNINLIIIELFKDSDDDLSEL